MRTVLICLGVFVVVVIVGIIVVLNLFFLFTKHTEIEEK
jgi:hypothetical protein